MHVRALFLVSALVLVACGDSDTDPVGPLTRPGGILPPPETNTTPSSATSCCGLLEFVSEVRGAEPYWVPKLEVWDATEWDVLVASMPATGTARASLVASTYWLILKSPPNCSGRLEGVGDDHNELHIAGGDTVHVSATLDCEPVGTARVTVHATGGDLPSSISVTLRRQDAPGIWDLVTPIAITQFMIPRGDWTVEAEVADHCVTTEVEPAAFSLAEGSTVEVAIRMSCERLNGMLHVTTSTTGGDAKLVLHTGGECVYEYDLDYGIPYSINCFDLPANGASTLYVKRGSYTAWVTHGVAGCTVLPSDSVAVEIVGGETTELAVTAMCD